MKVCKKVKEKGVTTYNEVADELVIEQQVQTRASIDVPMGAPIRLFAAALLHPPHHHHHPPFRPSPTRTLPHTTKTRGVVCVGGAFVHTLVTSVLSSLLRARQAQDEANVEVETNEPHGPKNIRRRVYDALNVLMVRCTPNAGLAICDLLLASRQNLPGSQGMRVTSRGAGM